MHRSISTVLRTRLWHQLQMVLSHQFSIVDVWIMSRIDDLPIEIKNPVDRDAVVLGRQQEGQLLGILTPRPGIFVTLFDCVLVHKL